MCSRSLESQSVVYHSCVDVLIARVRAEHLDMGTGTGSGVLLLIFSSPFIAQLDITA